MKISRCAMGDFGVSTRPISFAPAIKANKDKLLLKFRNKLGAKGYSPAEALSMAAKVRSEANDLAIEMNARQGNDDPVRMANIHTLALKLKIKQALAAAPSKTMQGEGLGRISKTSPMAVSVADKGKAYDTHIVKDRARARGAKRAKGIYDAEMSRKMRGLMKDDILREAMRTSYMQQFNGSMGHYGTMGIKFSKPKFVAKAQTAVKKVAAKAAAPIQKVAAPIKQAASYTAKSAVRAANIVKKDPIGALAKATIAAPFTIVASIAPANTVVGKAARKAEEVTVKGFKFSVELIKKVLVGIKDLVMKALQPIIDLFKKAWDGIKSVIVGKVAARFTGAGVHGFGALPEDEQKKLTQLSTDFASKKALEAAGVQTTILGTAAATGTATATAAVTAAAAAAGPAAPAVAAAAAPAAAASAATAATPTATAATSAYIAKVTSEGVNDVGAEFAKYKAAKAVPNPIAQKVLNAAIDGDLKKIAENPQNITKMAQALPEQAREKFIKEIARAPEKAKEELIKKAFVPPEFKKTVEFLPAEAKALAAGKPAIPQIAIAESMQKAYSKNPNIKEISPAQAKAEAAKGVLVQDQLAVDMVKEGKMNMTQAIVASSKIGKEAAISKLPEEARPAAIAEVKKEMSNVEVARIDKVAQDQKQANTGAFITAAAIAAKVLLF